MPDILSPPRRPGRRRGISVPWPSDQYIIGLLLLGTLLATLQLLTLGVAALAAFILLYAFVERQPLMKNIYVLPILALLGYGLMSALWSDYPNQTIYYGIQIVLTGMIGLIFASSPRPFDTLFGLATALIVHSTLSHILGKYVPWEHGQVVFVGIAGSKNNYGSISSLTTMTSLGLLYAAIHLRRRWVMALAAWGILVGTLGLIRSLATGNFLATVACCMFLMYINVYRVLTPRVRLATNLYAIYAAICVGLVFFFVKDQLMTLVLTALNKDVTLTGRTEIWDVALEQIKHHFWLGVGQSAFWVEGNPPAEFIWQSHGIAGKRGFNFHNTYLEIMVHFGLIGALVFGATFLFLIYKAFENTFKNPTIMNGIWLTFVLHFILLSPVESFNFTPINFYTVFLIAALARHPKISTLEIVNPWQGIFFSKLEREAARTEKAAAR